MLPILIPRTNPPTEKSRGSRYEYDFISFDIRRPVSVINIQPLLERSYLRHLGIRIICYHPNTVRFRNAGYD